MVEWHHWLNGHEFGWTPGVGDGHGGLVCCSSRGRKSQTQLSDWTERTGYLEKCYDRKYVTYLALHILIVSFTYFFHINSAVWWKGKYTGEDFRKILLHYQVVMWFGINHLTFLDFIFIFHIMRWLVRFKFHLDRSRMYLQCWRPWFNPWVGKIPWRREWATHSSILAWRIPVDRETWRATVHGVAKSWTQLSD